MPQGPLPVLLLPPKRRGDMLALIWRGKVKLHRTPPSKSYGYKAWAFLKAFSVCSSRERAALGPEMGYLGGKREAI